MPTPTHHTRTQELLVLAAYYAVLVLFLVASFFPQYRIWGVNLWAYFPDYIPFALFGLGALVPLVFRFALKRGASDGNDNRILTTENRKYLIVSICLIVLYGLAFYFLRVKTHFLGDGLTSLSYLASDNPLLRSRELGESLIHIWLKSLIGGDAKAAALLSFQIISISAGVFFLMAVAFAAKRLFDRANVRILFFLGLASGGYMLLFFGYVEYYSMFVLAVTVFSLVGLLAVRRKVSRWLIVPILGLAIFFHILAVLLLPAAIYVLLVNSKVEDKTAGINPRIKLLSALLGALIAVVVYSYFYKTDYFFQLAFIPIVANRFTVEGYTLFSLNHLVDVLNLLILLLPAFPILVAVLFFLRLRPLARRREFRYLAILLLSTLGAAFIFDPKMGMPRDWDLFCFAGIPLALLYYFVILDNRKRITSYVMICGLSITLGLLSLIPRVVTHNVFEASVAQFEHYIALDKKKCAKGRAALVNYYYDSGDSAKAEIEKAKWYADVPEKPLFMKAFAMQKTNVIQAMSIFRQIIEFNPVWQDAWANMGSCYLRLRNYDSAITYIKIAVGINPYDAASFSNLAAAYMYTEDYKKAEKALLESISLENASTETHQNMIALYKDLYRRDKFLDYLLEAASRKDTPFVVFKELGDYYLKRGQYKKAAEAYRAAMQRGLDSRYVKELMGKYPQLQE